MCDFARSLEHYKNREREALDQFLAQSLDQSLTQKTPKSWNSFKLYSVCMYVCVYIFTHIYIFFGPFES